MTDFKPAEIKPEILFSDLEKIDIRVGTIEKVEDIENSDKLVSMTVDFGDSKKTVVVGMKKERENPKEVEGKQALFIVNLPKKKFPSFATATEGAVEIESEAMLFDIGYADGVTPVLAMPEKPVPNGVRAG